MPDTLNENGLTLKTAQEIETELKDGFKEIYGNDINLDSDSPDGQRIGIYKQMALDIRESILRVYNSFDPDNSVGTVLDQRVTINNIQRVAGDFTVVGVDITTNESLALKGLDGKAEDEEATSEDAFTVQDNSGNQFFLIDSYTFPSATTQSLNFRAKDIGNVEATINTIQSMVTVILGVTNVNNPSAVISNGEDQETDAELRRRRIQTVANGSTSYVDSILSSIFEVDGVFDAKIFENFTSSPDADLIPAHSIWAIVNGGASNEIAQAIYDNKSTGSGMKGSVSIEIASDSGQVYSINFDRSQSEDLYIELDIQQTDATAGFDLDAIKEFLVENLTYGINDSANSATIISLLTPYLDGGLPINVGVSNDGVSYSDYLETSTKQDEFTLDESRISISIIT